MKATLRAGDTKGRACAVCDQRDIRALTDVRLEGGAVAVLCGSHALMHRRAAPNARTLGELRTLLRERRARVRRAREVDELAAELTAAFAGDRRAGDRRRA